MLHQAIAQTISPSYIGAVDRCVNLHHAFLLRDAVLHQYLQYGARMIAEHEVFGDPTPPSVVDFLDRWSGWRKDCLVHVYLLNFYLFSLSNRLFRLSCMSAAASISSRSTSRP